MPTENTPTDPRIQRTQSRLRRAFADLVGEKGYQQLTVQEIVGRADVNRTTFYRHFNDREALMRYAINHLVEDLVSAFDALPQEVAICDPTVPVWRLARFFERALEDRDFLVVMAGPNGAPTFSSSLEQSFESVVYARIKRTVVDEAAAPVPVPITVAFIAGAYMTVLKWWLENATSFSAEFVAEKVLELLSSGVYAALGAEIPQPPFLETQASPCGDHTDE